MEDPYPTGKYPDQKVWVWVLFPCLIITHWVFSDFWPPPLTPPENIGLKSLGLGSFFVPECGALQFRSAPKGRQQMGETGFCENLRFSAVSCENLRFPAVFCANQRLPNPLIYRASRKSAKICKNLRKCAFRVRFLSPFCCLPFLEGYYRVPKSEGYQNQSFSRALSGPFPPTPFPPFFPPLSPSGPVHFPTTSPLFTSPSPPPFFDSLKTPI